MSFLFQFNSIKIIFKSSKGIRISSEIICFQEKHSHYIEEMGFLFSPAYPFPL